MNNCSKLPVIREMQLKIKIYAYENSYPIVITWEKTMGVWRMGREDREVEGGNSYTYKTMSWKITITIKIQNKGNGINFKKHLSNKH